MNGALSEESYGHSATLSRKANQSVQYRGPAATLRVDVYLETQYRLRVKISDPNTNRYEVLWPPRSITNKASGTLYTVTTGAETFNFTVSRVNCLSYGAAWGAEAMESATSSNKARAAVLNSLYGRLNLSLVTANATRAPSPVLRLPTNITLTMFSQDTPPLPSQPTENLYGVHPFYLGLEQDGRAHGVFLLNSNAMGPDQVIQQYTELIGRPYLPPYWSLGFHLSRWGYMTANNTLAVVERMRQKGIPQVSI
ncbi:hypothetical protein EMCRGX_G015499 [Ephydatia muelleri]